MEIKVIEVPMPTFVPFKKIPRLFREITISEKIDGTNAQVVVLEDGSVRAGSRNRWITPEADNYGFARWVEANKDELRKLGPGVHYGEWWGLGIQRGYGLQEKRFSLFNVGRWTKHPELWPEMEALPSCCHVVPVLYRGEFDTGAIRGTLALLADRGSEAAPGFPKPEGIIIFHTASRELFKVTCETDESPKSKP